jgi:hypothetical protein
MPRVSPTFGVYYCADSFFFFPPNQPFILFLSLAAPVGLTADDGCCQPREEASECVGDPGLEALVLTGAGDGVLLPCAPARQAWTKSTQQPNDVLHN